MYKKRGQVTIFIIIAIVIVAFVVAFFLFRQTLTVSNIPASIQPVYNSFLSCLEDKTQTGINILESQAGYIELPKFEKGSTYMPFSSQLDLFGNPVPYWYYVSENNIEKEQIPSKQDIEKGLGKFIDEKIRECNFQNYYREGIKINMEIPETTVSIKPNSVDVTMKMNLEINKGNDTALVTQHFISTKSNLGSLYNSAEVVYQKEKTDSFLENYGVDTLRLYAPVDGVELTCSPKTWDANDVFNQLQEAIEVNTLALNTNSPSTKEEKYFSVSIPTSDSVRFINSKNWASSFEVLPSQENMLIANPVGNQPGLGILGFCYVPYHFVYNIKYPVLVQVYNGDEIFQFPVAVVIQGNKPRQALNSSAKIISSQFCPYKNTPVTVKISDRNMNNINASISYECFGQSCDIGETSSSGILTTNFPQCVNGFVIARAYGFAEARQLYSTTQTGSVEIVMDKLYNLDANLKVNGADYDGRALIYFTSERNSKIVSYPEQKNVDLSEGNYNISVYIYKNSTLQFKETTQHQCVDVPSSGIGGIFGFKEKNCFDIKIPAQIISNALVGGGKFDEYSLSEDTLKNSNTIEINAKGFNTPSTIEELQNNYLLFDDSTLEVNFK